MFPRYNKHPGSHRYQEERNRNNGDYEEPERLNPRFRNQNRPPKIPVQNLSPLFDTSSVNNPDEIYYDELYFDEEGGGAAGGDGDTDPRQHLSDVDLVSTSNLQKIYYGGFQVPILVLRRMCCPDHKNKLGLLICNVFF